jgi:hypothetical protein
MSSNPGAVRNMLPNLPDEKIGKYESICSTFNFDQWPIFLTK